MQQSNDKSSTTGLWGERNHFKKLTDDSFMMNSISRDSFNKKLEIKLIHDQKNNKHAKFV
jgi:hypothetical protein